MDLQLSGKRALVTGSSSGIGAGVAKILALEGVKVVVHGRDAPRAKAVADEINAAGGTAVVVLGDLLTEAGCDAVAEAAEAAFGGIDILVNNAGGTHNATGVGFVMAWEDWATTYDKNVGATVRMVMRLAEPMKARGWGRIINLGSFAGQAHTGTGPAYAATKAAIANLTLGLSKQLKFTGVTANTISPGMIETPALEGFWSRIGKAQGHTSKQQTVDYALDNLLRQSVSRLGQVEDVGNTVAFLASPLADFVNGANWRVDGGAAPHV